MSLPPGPRGSSFAIPFALSVGFAVATCGEPDAGDDPVEGALERSRAVAAAEWSYGADTLPPAQGEQTPRIVDRCRLTFPPEVGDAGDAAAGAGDGAAGAGDGADGAGSGGRTVDVACGHLFIGLEADADSAWIDRLVDGLGGEVVERGVIPRWTTALGEPVRYVLVRVEHGREGRTLERALSSEGVRFVDVREVARRRP